VPEPLPLRREARALPGQRDPDLVERRPVVRHDLNRTTAPRALRRPDPPSVTFPPTASRSWSFQRDQPWRVPIANGRVHVRRGKGGTGLGILLESNPLQGGGPVVTNWDWSGVSGHQSLAGTTWGDYTLTGTYDGDSFTMTRPPVPGIPGDGGGEESASSDEFAAPCPEPAGGWRVVDPSRTTYEAMETTFAAARSLDGYAGAWMDQSINPASGSPAKNAERLMNDPTRLIINVTVTGDSTAAEAKLRETWGGALCVSPAQYTEAELLHVLDEVTR
jgi:hypothetical protein